MVGSYEVHALIIHAVAPWESEDAKAVEARPIETHSTQEQIDYCVNHCPYAKCIDCMGGGKSEKKGRPRQYSQQILRELMTLKRTNAEMCAALGCSERTLRYYKRREAGERCL